MKVDATITCHYLKREFKCIDMEVAMKHAFNMSKAHNVKVGNTMVPVDGSNLVCLVFYPDGTVENIANKHSFRYDRTNNLTDDMVERLACGGSMPGRDERHHPRKIR